MKIIPRTLNSMLAFVSRTMLSNYVYTIHNGVSKGLKRKGGLGFLPRKLTREDIFLSGLSLRDQTVYDVGGYEGIMTLFFARAAGPKGRVLTFEPNPVNILRIKENVELNHFRNVDLHQLGLGSESQTLSLVFPSREPARGSLWSEYQKQLVHFGPNEAVPIQVHPLDLLIEEKGLLKPDFVKIDVEGMELEVLKGMTRTLSEVGPSLFVEIHTGVDHRKIVNLLLESGYQLRHVESGSNIEPANADQAAKGHLYAVKNRTRDAKAES